MLTWDSISKWGRRGSDAGAIPAAAPARDLMLEAIIAHEQVELVYQPVIEASTGRVVGAEALARCAISESADALFARAASAALGERLSRLLQRKALRSAAVWEGPLKGLNVSINLLPADVCRHGYDEWLLDEVRAAAIDPRRITLEITEGTLVADHRGAGERLARLREAGLRVAIDDFGTGYASLAYLTALPIDLIKIDRGLVARIASDERDRIVVRALIQLARDLGLDVLVEGVETAGQLSLLNDWGCDFYQGFLSASPMSHEELIRFVAGQA